MPFSVGKRKQQKHFLPKQNWPWIEVSPISICGRLGWDPKNTLQKILSHALLFFWSFRNRNRNSLWVSLLSLFITFSPLISQSQTHLSQPPKVQKQKQIPSSNQHLQQQWLSLLPQQIPSSSFPNDTSKSASSAFSDAEGSSKRHVVRSSVVPNSSSKASSNP